MDPQIGKFEQKLSFVHEKDVAEIAVKALFIEQVNGIYNITDGYCYGRYDFGNTIKNTLQKKRWEYIYQWGLWK